MKQHVYSARRSCPAEQSASSGGGALAGESAVGGDLFEPDQGRAQLGLDGAGGGGQVGVELVEEGPGIACAGGADTRCP